MASIDPVVAQEVYNNSKSTPPSFGGSVFNSFKGAFLTLPALVVAKANEIGTPVSPRLQSWKATYDQIQEQNHQEEELTTNSQLNTRKVASAIPNLIGGALDPVSAAAGVATGGVGGLVIGKIAPAMIEKQIARKVLIQQLGGQAARKALPITAKEVGAAGAHGAAAMVGFGAPTSIVANMEEGGTNVNWVGVAKESMENGAIGFALPIVGYGMGMLWHSYFPGEDKTPIPHTADAPSQLQRLNAKFEAGEIPKHEFELMRDYLENPDNPTLKDRFNEAMLGRNQKTNSANYTAYFGMLTDEDMNNLKSIIPTELENHLLATDKNALSEFTLHNRLDELRKNPHLINGLRGFIDTTDHALNERRIIFKENEARMIDHFERSINENMEFSQHEIMKYIDKVGREESHINNLPVEIPDNIFKRIKAQENINKLKVKMEKSGRNKQTERRIKELEDSLPKLLTPKEELLHIKDKLLSDKAYPRNRSMTKLYNRLSDLSEVWDQAKLLKDYIDSSHEFLTKQEAFRNVAKAFIDVLNSNIDKFSDHNRVNAYLKERIQQATRDAGDSQYAGRAISTSEIESTVREIRKLPSDPNSVMEDFQNQVDSVNAKELSKDFALVKERFEQFQDNEIALADMVNCFEGR